VDETGKRWGKTDVFLSFALVSTLKETRDENKLYVTNGKVSGFTDIKDTK
jgi:hypothetical protein